jgi:hypothetical protein
MGQTLNLVSQFGAPTFTSLRTIGNATIGGNLVVSGSITAQSLIVSTTSVYSGSTRFGEIISNTHQFTGSIFTSGSITVVGQYNGNGAGLTGTAASLSIGGNAATATIAGTITSQANSATITAASTNTNNQIVLRDGSGNFSAGTITAALTGNASTATSASYATTAGTITSQANSATITAASTNTGNQIVLRDGSGNFSAGTITATLSGNATNISAYTINQNVGTGNSPTFTGLTVNGSITATGDIIAYYTSDKRHKNNIQPITNALLKVSKLNGVTWEWNGDVDEAIKQSPKTGLIAQEVEEVLPEVVKTRDDGFLALDYSKMMGLMVEAIKEQQAQIEELKLRL